MNEYISREAVFQVVHGIARGIADRDTEALKAKDTKAFYKAKGAKEILDVVDTDLCYIPAADVQLVDRWINAQKNPPPIVDEGSMISESVLILRDNGRCAVAYYCYDAEEGNYWTADDDKTIYEWEEVTYWQTLPELPKEGE